MPRKKTVFTATITFDINGVHGALMNADKAELRVFIMEALQSHGGSRPPEDWLFDSLEHVRVSGIAVKKD